ncbi:MAG: hypothetical protein ACOC2U_00510 [bacterium]
MLKVETEVTYIDKTDLIDDAVVKLENGDYDVNDITPSHLKNIKIAYKSNVLLFKYNNKYKVLKSRY